MAPAVSEWKPKRSFEEVEKLLCAEGSPLEMEKRVVLGQVQRIYKNIPSSVRMFFLGTVALHGDKTCVVFEQERLTYAQVKDRATYAAGILQDVYGVVKGDRVAICSRNYPDYLVLFWAIHVLGAVPVLVNAWLPTEPLLHCLQYTDNKVIFVDTERAERIKPVMHQLKAKGDPAVIVLRSQEGKGPWAGMEEWSSVLKDYKGDPQKVFEKDPQVLPEDNAMIIFTSGSTGLPKGVLLSQRAYLTAIGNAIAARGRAALRRGEDQPFPPPEEGPQSGLLLPTPLFHSTGTSLIVIAAIGGMKMILMRKWDVKEAIRLLKAENIAAVGGVPSTIVDLVEGGGEGFPLANVMFGGSPVSTYISQRAKAAFPGSILSQAYGQTECNATAVAFSGEDFAARPTSCGRPMPVNDIMIVKDDAECAVGQPGEVWIRGPNVMKEYWDDPVATAKTVTKDGWLKTGDIGYVDEEGFLYIKDRLKDIIIRGGENVDSVMVENALYRDPRIFEAAAVGVPDHRLGELVTALVTLKSAYRGKGEVTEAELLKLARQHLPHFAVPVMILVKEGDFNHTPSEKIIKTDLRKIAAREWEKRNATRSAKSSSKL
ncbi:acetyl-CoA synthetase-like protein [Marasmius fiardii PR-910]|nr:acetyl-CoA synthetase-like protein [Marasmius fiardii PR-910]